MKTVAEHKRDIRMTLVEGCYELDEDEAEAFIRAIQADTLESAKVAIVAALQGDYYLEQAERVVSSTIDKLKPAAPASPEPAPR